MAMQYHTFLNVDNETGGMPVPQKEYAASGEFTAGETIRFNHNGEEGIPMVMALNSCKECGDGCTGLEGGDTIPPIAAEGNKVSIRINWPGCQPWSDPVGIQAIRDGRPTPVTKSKLACVVAKAIQKFYARHCRSGEWDTHAEWTPNVLPFEKLALYELRHVSKGSYQPVILRRP